MNTRPSVCCKWAMLIAMIAPGTTVLAQNSSLLHQPPSVVSMQRPPGAVGASMASAPPSSSGDNYGRQTDSSRPGVQLSNASWTYQPPPPTRVFRKNDVITIRVDEISRVLAQGGAQSRKNTLYEAILTDWLRITDFRFEPDPQTNGDPALAAESNSQYRAQSSIESRESMTFNIAAKVVDIRPNGNLVIEARKTIRVNDNLWETALSGVCRVEDIGPDNVVLSKDFIDLEIQKQDRGHLRDKYKRGWLSRWLDRVRPF